MKRVLVCGGRNYARAANVFAVLDKLALRHPFILIIGGAPGADDLARQWAEKSGNALAIVNANWDKFGSKAGPIRNSWMLGLQPDLVIGFPGGNGTDDMMRKAFFANITTRKVTEDGELLPYLDEQEAPF